MLAAHVFLNVSGKVITSYTDGVVTHNTAQRDDRDLGGTTANINNHVALRSFDVNTDANGRSHRFEDEIDITPISVLSRVTHRTQLHLGRTRRNTDDHA